jgi:hypothetical protein
MSLALRPTLALVLASFGALSPLRAQEVSVAPNSEIARCVSWMNATVPAKVDPADFCAGIKRGNSDGWWAVFKCGRTGQQIAGSPIKYCTSSGHITERETWGAGFRSTTRDGHDCRWEASGLLRGCTISCHPNHPRAGNLRSPNGAMGRIPRVI